MAEALPAPYPRLTGTHHADVLVEGVRLCGGTTGYTTAKVTSLHSLTYAQLVEQLGEDKARRYGEANQAALEQVANLVESLNIDCQFTRAPAYTYTIDAGGRIFEESRAVDIDERDGQVVVTTDGGEVTGEAAVVGTLLPFLDIGGFFAKAHPSRSYAISVRCRGPVPQGMYLSVDSPARSVRPVQ